MSSCRPSAIRRTRQHGFTLIEILMAIVVIGILATVAMQSMQSGIERARFQETQNEMAAIVFAIRGNPDLYANGLRSDFGYVGDVGAVPSSLDDLVSDPGLGTWNGPYLAGRFTEDTQGHAKDAWGNAYTFTNGITVASTGGGSTSMTESAATTATDLTNNTVSGIITDAVGNPPGDSSVAITVTITYPDGAGGVTSTATTPNAGGAFSFSNIPIGVRTVQAVYRATDDTVPAYAPVMPKTGAVVNIRIPGNPFGASAAPGGGGGGSGSIEYVPGSASTPGPQHNDVYFDITNTGTASVDVSSLIAVYSTTGYYKKIKWNGIDVFEEEHPRAGSGDTAPFNSTQTIAPGQTLTIQITDFKTNPTGGPNADMSSTDFTITFSDGSVITFNSGA